jgi:peroxiredoxin
MASEQSASLSLGALAPDFDLPDITGEQRSLRDFAPAPALLVAFICNHCPYVKHMLAGLVAFAHDYATRGLAVVAISSNDVASHPEDGPTEMAKVARARGFEFPYLYDESQSVATAYGAACTPDLFLFDAQRRLAYHGQFDASRPGKPLTVTGADLRAAADAVLSGKPIARQIPGVGCGIKWKPARGS